MVFCYALFAFGAGFVRWLMRRLDPAVKKETLRIAVGTLVLSAVMELVFLLLKRWDPTVLFGNLLGAFAAVLNFFLMCLTVTHCIALDKKKAEIRIRTSQFGRLLLMGGIAAVGALAPCFNLIAVLVPLLFPSIVIVFLRLIGAANATLQIGEEAGSAPAAPETSADENETEEDEL